MAAAGLEVREAGRALRVQTEAPHLVSMGSGRLSTAVTLHPLPEGMVKCNYANWRQLHGFFTSPLIGIRNATVTRKSLACLLVVTKGYSARRSRDSLNCSLSGHWDYRTEQSDLHSEVNARTTRWVIMTNSKFLFLQWLQKWRCFFKKWLKKGNL